MKGLILNSSFHALNNMKLILVLILGGGIALLITGSPNLAEVFVHVSIILPAIAALSGMNKDHISKWDVYELILPIKRKDVVKSKYYCYLFWVFIGLLLSFVFVILTTALHGNIFYATLQNTASPFSLGAGIGVITGAIFYPLAYIFGIDKSELLLALSAIAAVALTVFLIPLINLLGWSLPFKVLAFTASCACMYTLSYFLTLKLYSKIEL